MEQQWCPLFGTLPSCGEPDRITENCLQIIFDARQFWGTYVYCNGVSSPDPERVEKYTNYPAIWIKSARFLLHKCSTNDILFSARHDQGLIQSGTGWVEGRDESFLTVDSDQLNPGFLMRSIGNRAGLPHDFMVAMIDNKDPRYLDDDRRGVIITPAMIFALMSICVAWHLLKDIGRGSVKVDGKDALSELLKADKLLKAANCWGFNQITAKENVRAEKARQDGSQGGSESGNKKKVDASVRHEKWQKMADEIWKKRPKLKDSEVARIIEKRSKDDVPASKWSYIRTKISKQSNN